MMRAKTFAFILLAVLLAMAVSPVYAASHPAIPHAFYGGVDINGSPAPVGTAVEARGEGVETGVDNNPIVTIAEGKYGGSDGFDPKLIVWGNIAEGSIVTFYVNGFSTGQTAQWQSGGVTELDLAATIEEGAVPEEPPDTGDTPPDTGDSTPPDTGDSTPPDEGDSTPPDMGGPTPPSGPSEPGDSSSGPPVPPPPPSDGVGGVPVLWLIVGGAVLVGLIIAFWIARSRAY
jgi:hypothetical protein